jgi:hypothetical protein
VNSVGGIAAAAGARERRLADALFVLQCLCATAFGVAQFLAMQRSVEGVSTSWFLFWVAFLVVNLVLAVNAYRVYASRIAWQTVVIYALWTVVCATVLVELLLEGGLRWNHVDDVTAAITVGGSVVAILVGHRRGLPVSDPLVRAAFAVLCKAVPQLTLAWNIWEAGGDGISAVAFAAGHVTICMRLWQVWLSIREAGWDRNRLGIAIGEVANEASWVVATMVWLAVG